MRKLWPYLVLVLVVGGIIAYVVVRPHTAPVPVEMSTSEAPWGVASETLKARLDAIHLPALSEEGNALHIHQHLDLFVHGQAVGVPSDIGIHETFPPFIAPIHTHDTAGIIHVESPTVETFTLGQFFDVWGVRLTESCIGGYCTDETNALKVFVNGQPYSGDPRGLELAAHQEIVITYGTDAEIPASIPTSYSFPEGY
jgi:hypothetical protein